MRLLNKAEAVLVEDYKRYKSHNEVEMLEHSLAALVSFDQIAGRNGKTEQYLREREATFRDSLEAKLCHRALLRTHRPQLLLRPLEAARNPPDGWPEAI